MKKIRGAITALITPFTTNGKLDEEGFKQNLNFQISNGIDGLVPLGTTGEAPTLTHEEKEKVIKLTVKAAKGKVPIIVGTGSYSTQLTIEYTQQAAELGADMALIVTPYYNKPTQEGLYKHFKAITESTPLPIMVYNIQGRTGQNLETNTLRRIADLPNIIGVKEASGNISQVGEVIETIARHRPNFSVLSGDDANTLVLMALGGDGVISVISNLIPAKVKQLVEAIEKGNLTLARELHYQMMPIVRGAFLETNPSPIKAAMNYFGMPSGGCRLPLCDLTTENIKKLSDILDKSQINIDLYTHA
jgi:4-hydroxy-tetrahydrodipicolinate synthase